MKKSGLWIAMALALVVALGSLTLDSFAQTGKQGVAASDRGGDRGERGGDRGDRPGRGGGSAMNWDDILGTKTLGTIGSEMQIGQQMKAGIANMAKLQGFGFAKLNQNDQLVITRTAKNRLSVLNSRTKQTLFFNIDDLGRLSPAK
jgi:hypothetical protein